MKQRFLTGCALLFALILINGGLNKFLHYMPVPENLPEALVKDTDALLEISWLIPLIGFAEIMGGLLLLLPRTRALGILVIFPMMVGVLLTHLFVDTSGLPVALVLWAILLWMIYENKAKFYPLVSDRP